MKAAIPGAFRDLKKWLDSNWGDVYVSAKRKLRRTALVVSGFVVFFQSISWNDICELTSREAVSTMSRMIDTSERYGWDTSAREATSPYLVYSFEELSK